MAVREPKRDFLAPKDPEKAHWNAMALAMTSFRASEGWDSYRRLLEDAENGWIQRLLTENRDTYDFNKGVIHGLRLAFGLPDQIIAKAASQE